MELHELTFLFNHSVKRLICNSMHGAYTWFSYLYSLIQEMVSIIIPIAHMQ